MSKQMPWGPQPEEGLSDEENARRCDAFDRWFLANEEEAQPKDVALLAHIAAAGAPPEALECIEDVIAKRKESIARLRAKRSAQATKFGWETP
jgi:hypothetical protein